MPLAQMINRARDNGGIRGPMREREYQPAANGSKLAGKAVLLGAVALAAGVAAAAIRGAR